MALLQHLDVSLDKRQFQFHKFPFRFQLQDHPGASVISCVASRASGKTQGMVNSVMKHFCAYPRCDQIWFGNYLRDAENVFHNLFLPHIPDFSKYGRFSYDHERRLFSLDASSFQRGQDRRNVFLKSHHNIQLQRGAHAHFVYIDEAGSWKNGELMSVVLPMVAHASGSIVYLFGTPKGHNDFYYFYMAGVAGVPGFKSYRIPASSGVIPPDKLAFFKKQAIASQQIALFQQEYECDFDVGISDGSVWAEDIFNLRSSDRLSPDPIPFNPSQKCFLSWDLGHSHATVVWLFQLHPSDPSSIDVLGYYEDKGHDIRYHLQKLLALFPDLLAFPPSLISCILPHDARNHVIQCPDTVVDIISEKKWNVHVLPQTGDISVGIFGVKEILRSARFSQKSTSIGIQRLQSFQVHTQPDSHIPLYSKPVQNEHTDAADAFRYISESSFIWKKSFPSVLSCLDSRFSF